MMCIPGERCISASSGWDCEWEGGWLLSLAKKSPCALPPPAGKVVSSDAESRQLSGNQELSTAADQVNQAEGS